jgi:L-ascorbate metabolism protein UlaG (beta-lactamase superfamily)
MTTGTQLTINAVGGPTAIIEMGGVRLLTDPTFDPPREYTVAGRVLVKSAGPALQPAGVGRIDAVLLSHDQHVDNLDLAGREFLAGAPVVLTTAAAAARLGAGSRPLGPWQHFDLARPGGGALRVTRVPALHGPAGSQAVVGEVAGFVLSSEGLPSVYVSGDNASLDVVQDIGRRVGRVDVAVLFAGAARTTLADGAYLTLTSPQAAEAARILNAALVVPLHFNGWRHFTEGGGDLLRAFAAAGLADRLTLLAPGDRVEV